MKNIVMKTDVGDGQIMNEFYQVNDAVNIKVYAEGMINNYNASIRDPFDMPRKLIEVNIATIKDYLDSREK